MTRTEVAVALLQVMVTNGGSKADNVKKAFEYADLVAQYSDLVIVEGRMRLTAEQVAHIQELYNLSGRLTPDLVVTDAARRQSPLRSLFDGLNPMSHQIARAREVISAVRVVITRKKGVA